MKYDLNTKYRITASGTSKEIKLLIEEISNIIDKGTSYNQLENELNNLEKIIEPQQYTFGLHHRIYFNHNSFLYVPNVSSKEGQEFHYSIFKKIFDKVIKNIPNVSSKEAQESHYSIFKKIFDKVIKKI